MERGLQFIAIQEIINVPINGFFSLSFDVSKNDFIKSSIFLVKYFTTRYIQTKATVNSYTFPDNSNFCDFF
jgi:hypothetical protein